MGDPYEDLYTYTMGIGLDLSPTSPPNVATYHTGKLSMAFEHLWTGTG